MTRSHSRTRIALAAIPLAAIALLVAAAPAAQAQSSQGTPEQRRACRKDAMTFCREFVPNVKLITACMEKNVSKLSPLCKTQFK